MRHHIADDCREERGKKRAYDGSEACPAHTSDKQEPDKFVLKHLDDTHEVNRDEVIALAQKGLDYDRIRERLAAADTELTELRNKRAELDTATAELDELKTLFTPPPLQ